MSDWISVKKRLPAEPGIYLAYAQTPFKKRTDPLFRGTGSRYRVAYFNERFRLYNVSHWMPLPEPPEAA